MRKFGPAIARRLRRRRPRPSDRWHLDEMVVRIAGERMYLWRAVDHESEVLDMQVQRRRDTRAAQRLMRKRLKKHNRGGEFASGSPTTRAQAAAVQAGSIRPELSQRARCGSQYLQLSTPPHLPIHTADLPSRGYRTVARCRRTGMTRGESWLSTRARWSCRDNADGTRACARRPTPSTAGPLPSDRRLTLTLPAQ